MTNPTISAEERASQTMASVQVGGSHSAYRLEDVVAEQIRQAEQAAYERAAQVAENCGEPCCQCVDNIRALGGK